MKLLVDNFELSKALSQCIKIIPSRPSHPILGNFLLEAMSSPPTNKVDTTPTQEPQEPKPPSDNLYIVGFNLSSGIKLHIDAKVKTEGKITVPAKLFLDIISKLPDGQVCLKTDDTMLSIESLAGTYELATVTAEDYPALPMYTGRENVINVNSYLLKGLHKVKDVASTDETKQVLTGINIKAKDGTLSMATTDGHRLSTFKKEDSEITQEFEVTLPAKSAQMIETFAGSSDDLEMIIDGPMAFIESKGDMIMLRTLEGNYPAYQNLIPNKFKGSFTVSRKAFIESVERIGVLAAMGNKTILLSIQDTSLTATVDAKDFGNAKEVLEVSADIDIKFSVNPEYLMSALKSISTDEVIVKVNTPIQPIIIEPLGGDNHLVLLMPIQMRGT